MTDAQVETMLLKIRQLACEVYRHIDQDREAKAMKRIRDLTDMIDAKLAALGAKGGTE